MKLIRVPGSNILYIGDHLHSDLKQPNRFQGWRTGVIISELEREINIQLQSNFASQLKKLIELTDLKMRLDRLSKDKYSPIMNDIRTEIANLRQILKSYFNPNFGSVFRTHSNATYFAYELQRYGDIYTSNIENFNNYPLDFVFSSGRQFLPHEIRPDVYLNTLKESKKTDVAKEPGKETLTVLKKI